MAKTSVRTGLMWAVASMLGVLALGLGAYLAVDAGSPRADTAIADSDGEQAAVTTIAGRDGGALADAASSFLGGPGEGEPLPPMGIATRPIDWTVTELPTQAGVWFHRLFVFGDELWALGFGYDEATERESVVVLVSADGATWTERALPAELGGRGSLSITPTETGLVAVTQIWDETGGSELLVHVSSDGVDWSPAAVEGLLPADSHVWINGIAGASDTIVMFGGAEPILFDGGEPTLTVEHDGKVVTVTPDGTYTVVDADGSVLATGPMDLVWRTVDEGPVVRDAEGNELLRVDWSELHRAGVAAYAQATPGAPLIIELEVGDLTLRIDEGLGRYSVVDASGAVIAEGDRSELTEGAPPTFTVPETGEVVLVVPWDVWSEAQELAYTSLPVRAQAVALVSTDGGVSWQEAVLPSSSGVGHVGAVTHGPAGFLATGFLESTEPGDAPGSAFVWRSDDGVTWTDVGRLGAEAWVSALAASDSGYLAAIGAEVGSAIHASPDGSAFQPVLTDADLLLPVGSASLHMVAAGDAGLFAAGSRDGWSAVEPTPVVIEKSGRVLELIEGVGSTTYRLTEGGAVVFEYVEEHRIVEDTGLPPVRWGEGGLAIYADDGTVLFAISHEEFERALDREPGVETWYIPEMIVLHDDGSGWASLQLPEGFAAHAFPAALTPYREGIAVLATLEVPVEPDEEYQPQVAVLWGVPGS